MTGRSPIDLLDDDLRIALLSTQNDRALVSWLEHLTEPTLTHRLQTATAALQELENPPALTNGSQPPSRRCHKYLKVRTQTTFHWVAPAISRFLNSIPSTSRWLFPRGNIAELSFSLILHSLCILLCVGASSGVITLILPLVLSTKLLAIGLKTVLAILLFYVFIVNHKQILQRLLEPFSDTHFTIDRSQVSITHYCLGKSWKTLESTPGKIHKICFSPKYFQPYASQGVGEDTKPVATPVEASLEIYVGTQKIKIPGTNQFNEHELEWLARELATFLVMEVQVTSAANPIPYPQTSGLDVW